MKKYTKPELTVTVFDCEDVMALSVTGETKDYTNAAGTNGSLDVVDVNNTATGQLLNPFK